MTPGTLTVRVPAPPPRECSPNWRGHWRKRSQAVRSARLMALMATRVALGDGQRFSAAGDGAIAVRLVVGLAKGQHRADYDNCLASTKAMLDGVCDALRIDDRRFRRFELEQVRDRDGTGFTEITLSEVEDRPCGIRS